MPDLIFEVRSETDRLDTLRAKIRQFLELRRFLVKNLPNSSVVQASRLRRGQDARATSGNFFHGNRLSTLELGTTVGALVDYQTQTIEVCCINAEPLTLRNGDRFTVPELLLGWDMEVSSIWAPEFN